MNHPDIRYVPPCTGANFASRFRQAIRGLAIATVALATMCLPDALSAASAPAQATGTISGRVQNSTNGLYLKNVRVMVEGTQLEAITDEYGEYTISNVPAGTQTVHAIYSGLDARQATVTVSAGATAQQNFALGNAEIAPTSEDNIVQLSEFVVSNSRETNAAAAAINEQRYSGNIKNVVAADAFGDVTEGNVGEFIKYLPGVTVDYVAADVRTISVRGFADNYTSVSVDGARMASAASGNSIRTFELEQVSINNVSRVEVTKEPLPSMPSDSLGGSVNMISRSAFERSNSTLKYKAYVSLNSEDVNPFAKTPGPGSGDTYKVLPGFDFNYIAPITPNFGIVVNGLSSNQFNEQHRSQRTYRFTGAGATVTAPYLRQYQMQDGPKNSYRDSFSIKADWRPAEGHVISAGVQGSYYKSFFGNRNLNFDVGSSNTATGTSITPSVGLTHGPDFTHGATNRGSVSQGGSWRNKYGATRAANLSWRYVGRDWEANAGVDNSISKSWYRLTSRGQFNGYSVTMLDVSRVNYDDINETRPGKFTVLNSAGGELDYANLSNYRLNNVNENPVDGRDEFKSGRFNVKRKFEIMDNPSSIMLGVDVRKQDRDMRRRSRTWTFVGEDGVAGTADDNAGAFLDPNYSSEDPSWGFGHIEWPDSYALYDDFVNNPDHFVSTDKNLADAYNATVNGSEAITETVSAGFLQAETHLFNNRLQLIGGVRYEKTKDEGRGALFDPDAAFVRNADGSFATNADGDRIRKPEAGAAGSFAEAQIIRTERGAVGGKTYDGFYPSLHATVNLTDNLLLRAAFARTFGRPDFGEIIPNVSIDENDDPNPSPGSSPGTITIRNPGLQPWTAMNYDLSLEYYFPKGGVLSGGVFQKNIKNFFGSIDHAATAEELQDLGLSTDYVDWRLKTKVNVGDAEIAGAEFNFSHPLTFLGEWGRQFNFIANATALNLKGAANAQFNRFITRSGNVGITYSRSPLIIMVKVNLRGRQRNSLQSSIAPDAYEYYRPRYNLDVNAEYEFSKRFTAFVNARNITNVHQVLERYSPITPQYSHMYRDEVFGVQIALGLKGSF